MRTVLRDLVAGVPGGIDPHASRDIRTIEERLLEAAFNPLALTGHSAPRYREKSLDIERHEGVERALWAAARALEESAAQSGSGEHEAER